MSVANILRNRISFPRFTTELLYRFYENAGSPFFQIFDVILFCPLDIHQTKPLSVPAVPDFQQ